MIFIIIINIDKTSIHIINDLAQLELYKLRVKYIGGHSKESK